LGRAAFEGIGGSRMEQHQAQESKTSLNLVADHDVEMLETKCENLYISWAKKQYQLTNVETKVDWTESKYS
jgi:hypothetical protein